MKEPYFLRFIHDLDLAEVEAHDKLLLEQYATAADLHHEGKHGQAVRVLRGAKAGLLEVREWITKFGNMLTDEGARQTFEAYLAPGAEGRFPVPFHLRLFQEEAFALRYFREEAYPILVVPLTLFLGGLKGIPPAALGPLAELMRGTTPLTESYAMIMEELRRVQSELRGLTCALAEGKPRTERVNVQATGIAQDVFVTDGQRCWAYTLRGRTFGQAVYDFWKKVMEPRVPLKICAWKECRRVFIPWQGRQRCHSSLCSRRAKEEWSKRAKKEA